MRQTLSNTKKSLGRVWFRYFQLYGMTRKLTVACVNIGWTRVDMDTYAKGHCHLVNQLTANMVKDSEPDVSDPGDLEWLTSPPQWQEPERHHRHKCVQAKRRGKLEDTDQELWH